MDPTAKSRDQEVVLHDLPGHHKKFSNKKAPIPAKKGSGESVGLGRLGRTAQAKWHWGFSAAQRGEERREEQGEKESAGKRRGREGMEGGRKGEGKEEGRGA